MFESLPHTLKEHKLSADVRTLIMLRKSIEKGLVHTLGDVYLVLKGLVCHSPQDFGPFATAFYQYFLAIEIAKGESLDNAILRSETFKTWKKNNYPEEAGIEIPSAIELADEFLNQVHASSYDIQQMLSGKDIFNNDNPTLADNHLDTDENRQKSLSRAADYSDLSIDQLLERMKQVAKQQTHKHQGGSHWIGSGGISAYGNQGAAVGGIRVGGSGGGKMARKVIGDQNFYPIDTKITLSDNNIDVALAFLKGIEDQTSQLYLDIPATISEGIKQGAIFLPIEKEKIEHKVQVILLIDNGGWSMSPYIRTVTKLFSKMKRRFAHDLKTYYFHNTIYGGAYTDATRFQFESLETICALHKNYSIFIVGDADMAPYELTTQSMQSWELLKKRFERMVWLNPLDEGYWKSSMSVMLLKEFIPMFALTPEGIEKAVELMNKKRLVLY